MAALYYSLQSAHRSLPRLGTAACSSRMCMHHSSLISGCGTRELVPNIEYQRAQDRRCVGNVKCSLLNSQARQTAGGVDFRVTPALQPAQFDLWADRMALGIRAKHHHYEKNLTCIGTMLEGQPAVPARQLLSLASLNPR